MMMRMLICISALCLTFFVAVSGTGSPKRNVTRFVVAPDGDDAAAGDAAHPFATLQRARDAIRKLKRNNDGQLPGPVTVQLRGGMYTLEKPLKLGPQDSGSADCPVTWEAWPAERPIISGGTRITGWQQAHDGVWSVELPAVRNSDWYFHQLFIRQPGDRDYTRRYRPTRGLFVIAGLTDAPHLYPNRRVNHRNPQNEFVFHKGDIEAWENLKDVEVVVLHDWSSSRMTIDEIEFDERIVRFTDYPHYRIGHWYPGGRNPYLIENVKQDFGKPAEWYLDRPTGTLSYTPVEGEQTEGLQVVAPRLERLLRVTGDEDAEHYVEHLTFRGLVFAHSAWHDVPRHYAEAHGLRSRQGFVEMPSAIELKWARQCKFEACTMAHLGAYALDFGEGCHENVAAGNRIFDCGTGGVKVGTGDRKVKPPIVPTDNRVKSNLVSDVGIVHYSGHGIWGGMTGELDLVHNEVRRTLYSAVAVGWSHSERQTTCHDNHFLYNHIHGVMLLLDHGGALYTLGNQPGTVLRGNLIHDTHQTRLHGKFERPKWAGGGLAFDDGSKNFLIDENVIYDTAAPPDLAVKSGRDRHKVGTNYFGTAPGEEGFPAEIAEKAGPQPKWSELTELPVDVPEPAVLSLPYPFDAPPLAISESFENQKVGEGPTRGRARVEDKEPAKGTDAIEVTDKTAASGEHSLLIQDAPNLSHDWVPYVNYSPGYSAGLARLTFDIRLEKGVHVECVWRGSAKNRQFSVGPQLVLRDEGLYVDDEKLMGIPFGVWAHIEVECRLGAPDPGIGGLGTEDGRHWKLKVTLPQHEERVFEELPINDAEFKNLRWVGFISLATKRTRFFLDNVQIGIEQ